MAGASQKKTAAFRRLKRFARGLFLGTFYFLLAVAILLLGTSIYVCASTAPRIHAVEDYEQNTADAILVLGCGVQSMNPSLMLRDRLDTAIALYNAGVAPKLLMSGDHGGEYYNEVGVMKAYAMEHGIPSEDIFMDHAGFSTYESLYRAKALFGCDSLVVVTQEYHLYRTLHLGNRLGLNISGGSAPGSRYPGQLYRELREILARDKDVITGLTLPPPSVPLGDPIDITGDGNITNDAAFSAILEQKGLAQ